MPRVLTLSAMCACAGLLAVASCTRTNDRVVEPVGGGDASTTVPEVTDASVTPIGPVARPPAKQEEQPSQEEPPAQDFRLARSPELGAPPEARLVQALSIKSDNALGGGGGATGNGGGAGRGAPVGTGAGSNYF